MNLDKFVKRYRIRDAEKFRLADFVPDDRGGLGLNKESAQAVLAKDIRRLADLQERLYAQDRWAVLVILQAMDAAGKDSVIKHVMTGINPQGCHVFPFKAPSSEDLDHDFLWRAARALPERGRIGIFNRSYYEDVLVVRVKRGLLQAEKLPPRLVSNRIWAERFKDIRAFERHLARNGTVVLKFFLYVSKDEQRQRFLDRLEEPAKRWKFRMGDIEDRGLWDRYMTAYEEMIRHTSTEHAPWHVVPADYKWFTQLVVAATIIGALHRLDLKYPVVKGEALDEMKAVRKALLAEPAPGDGEKEEEEDEKAPAPPRRAAAKLSGSRARSSPAKAARARRPRARRRKRRAGRQARR